jgi:hypothetical protein
VQAVRDVGARVRAEFAIQIRAFASHASTRWDAWIVIFTALRMPPCQSPTCGTADSCRPSC